MYRNEREFYTYFSKFLWDKWRITRKNIPSNEISNDCMDKINKFVFLLLDSFDKERVKLWEVAFNDMKKNVQTLEKMFQILVDDFIYAFERLDKNNGCQFLRREVNRVFFALVDGITYQMKQIALKASDLYITSFSVGELALLKEKEYHLKKGSLTERNKFIPTKENILFTMSMYSKTFHSKYKIEKNEGWRNFQEALKIRNKITHPKDIKGLKINNKELKYLLVGSEWYQNETITVRKGERDFFNLLKNRLIP